jgi:citrate lyase subunit beta/citryl-CoA lyase
MTVALSTQAGEAGHCGVDIRSDLRVRLEPRERGGLEIQIASRVEIYYGDLIRRQAEEVLEALGVRHAHVEIHDEGALPFVIAARIEAAARRAGLGVGTRVLPDRLTIPESSTRDRMRRSRLYVPGRLCTAPMASFSTSKTRCMRARRTQHVCWSATHFAP